MKTFKVDDVVLVPRCTNPVWAGVGVVYRTWTGDEDHQSAAGVLMVSGRMRGLRGLFYFSALCPAKIVSMRVVRRA